MDQYDRTELYIGGRWVTPEGRDRIPVVDPTTEQVIGHVPAGTAEDVNRAVTAARRAFDPTVSLAERRDRVARLVTELERRLPDIATTIGREVGAPLKVQHGVQTAVPLAIAASYRDLLDKIDFAERVGNSLVIREPYGVAGAITPWNYPLYQVVAKVLPAIAAGCTVVLKPSEVAPLSVYRFVEAAEAAGLPPGVLNLVTGYGPEVGEAIAAHPEVDLVSFTGSTATGRRVATLAAASVKKVALELGGKSANVILDDVNDTDLATAVKVGVGNAFLNSGQTCSAWTRMLVPEARYAEAVELARQAAQRYTVGDPFDPATRLGPLVSAAQLTRVRGFIERATADGARLVTGGSAAVAPAGYFVAPTVFADVHPDSELAQQEVFGPVLAILSYRDEEDALRIANATAYGLAGAVWAADPDRAIAFARRVRAGQLDICGGPYNPLAPFGGFGQSGVGRELGRAGLDEYLQTKSLQLPA